MKDPIQGTLDAVREVEIGVSQFRALLSEAAAAKEEAEAGAEALRAELQQSRLLSARVQAEAFECRKEMERLRADYENGMRRDVEVSRQLEQFRTRRRELEAAHAAIWGLGCALTGAYADAKSARHTRNRLRRSNDRVREVLGAKPGESPVEAAERVARSRKNLESMAEKERVVMDRLVRQERSARDLVARLLSDMTYQQQRFDRMQADLVAERDAALARVAELERAIDLEWSPYVHRAAESKS